MYGLLLTCCSFVVFADSTVKTRTTDIEDGQKAPFDEQRITATIS